MPTEAEQTPVTGPRRPRWGWWAVLIGAVALGAILLYWKTRPAEPAAAAKAQAQATRTVKVTSGPLLRTIRLTGTTAARNYAQMVAPRMRGRGGMRQVNMGQMVQAQSSGGGGDHSHSDSSSSSSTTASGSASDTTSAASSSSSNAIGISGTSGAISASSNMVNSLTRFSGSTSSASTTKKTDLSASSNSSAMGSSGLGSTSNSLMGGGGGGGGGDFQLVLQKIVDGGARVKKGETIAEFDRQYMLQRLDDFRANHSQNQEALRGLSSNLGVQKKAHQQLIDAAQASLDKAQLDLKTTPVRSKIVAEQLKLAAEEAEANYKLLLSEVKFKDISWSTQMRIAKLDLDEEGVELRRAETNADRMLIKSPMDGIAVMSSIFRGGEFGQIKAGDELHPGQLFMQVVDQSSMVVNAVVSQADIEMIRVGAKAQVHFDAFPDLVLPATLYSIGAIAKSSGMRGAYVTSVPVVLKLDQIDPRVIPDLSVSVDLLLSKEDNATLAPLAGIMQDPGTGKPVAFVRSADGWEKREVELGPANNLEAIVRSGLRPGEVIAAEWPAMLKPDGKNKA